jgi:hypothetical protein
LLLLQGDRSPPPAVLSRYALYAPKRRKVQDPGKGAGTTIGVMFALLFLAQAIPQASPSRSAAEASAKVLVRIEHATSVRAEDWAKPKDVQRREVRRTGEDGRPILLRLEEHQ